MAFSGFQRVSDSQGKPGNRSDRARCYRSKSFLQILGAMAGGASIYDSTTRACTDQRVSARSEIVESAPAPARL